MKASVKFRDDRHPLVRAKVPISILSLPFLSAVSAGDSPSELVLSLSSALPSGPSLRLSYRPNLPSSPFSLSLKTGFGPLGSPADSPFSISAHFPLLPSSSPHFSLVFTPSLGDFSFKKSLASPPPPSHNLFVNDKIDDNISKTRHVNGFPMDITSAVNSVNSAAGVFSGFEVCARSVVPVRDRANVRLRWGVRVPAELRSAFGDSKGGFSFSKLPLLVMSKISIEHVPVEKRAKGKKKEEDGVELTEVCGSVKKEIEALRVENGMLRRAVELLRDDVGGLKVTGLGLPVGREVDVGRCGGKQPSNVGVKREYRSDVKSATGSSDKTHGNENVSEELKKALMKASGGGL